MIKNMKNWKTSKTRWPGNSDFVNAYLHKDGTAYRIEKQFPGEVLIYKGIGRIDKSEFIGSDEIILMDQKVSKIIHRCKTKKEAEDFVRPLMRGHEKKEEK